MAHIKRFVIDNWWCLLIIVTLLLSRIWLGTAIVSGTSMNNTLAEDDLLLIHKTKDVDRNDIVAIWYDGRTEYLCKRVIGVAGDKISIIQNKLAVNGEILDEPYVANQDWFTFDVEEVVVPENCVYVLGDNRDVSLDSRKLGCLSTDDIYGVSLSDLTKSYGITKKSRYYIIVFLVIVFLVISYIEIFVGRKKYKTDEDMEDIQDE